MRVGVVGGGPAGSRAAELLSRSGARVVVYEARAGWEKPCGGGVPERGIDTCPFLKDPSLPQRLTTRARIYSCSDREAIVPLAEPLRIFSRRDLNGCLLERAIRSGAEARSVRVAGLEREGFLWRLRDSSGKTETFDFLVGADGASGMVRTRVLGGAFPLRQSVGLGYFVEGFTSDEIILKFFSGLGGYLWIFPRTDHLAVGICGPSRAQDAGSLRLALERFLTDLFGASVTKRLRKYGARIPSLAPCSSVSRSCQGEGWALLGDAAGFVDPLTREGIHYALASADLLAAALAEGKAEAYGHRWEETFGAEMDWAARHQEFFFSRPFVEGFTLFSAASPAVRQVVSDLISGRQSYRSLRQRLVALAPAAFTSAAIRLLGGLAGRRLRHAPPTLTPSPSL
jgi:flavin-dependent dehydrogenase